MGPQASLPKAMPGEKEIVAFLRRPESYDEPTRTVAVVETHISWVFLTDTRAYKLKKRVCFDFLDFSTLQARRHACREEVRLNRRLASGVYLGIEPIVVDGNGRLRIGGEGEVIDWIVVMRRLDTGQSLERLIESGQLDEGRIEQLAERLATFYEHAAPLFVRSDEYLAAIQDHVRANREELLEASHGLPEPLVKRVHTAQLTWLLTERRQLEDRVCDGRIVDGHGDLRPEHVIFDESQPVVFDCIEFSEEFRRVDVADELSFLAMECDYLGASHVGRRVLEAYCAVSRDRPGDALLSFYKCYRACVRGKVAALRAGQHGGRRHDAAQREAIEYLRLADRYAGRLGPPLLVVVRGLMGSGKSTLASALSQALGADHLETDGVRRQLFDGKTNGHGHGYGQGKYSPDNRARVYDAMIRQASARLDTGVSTVLDGTFLVAQRRAEVQRFAARRGATMLVVVCRCPAEEARRRIAARLQSGASSSEARPDLFNAQAAEEEADPPGVPVIEIDTTQSLEQQLAQVIERLGEMRRNGA